MCTVDIENYSQNDKPCVQVELSPETEAIILRSSD